MGPLIRPDTFAVGCFYDGENYDALATLAMALGAAVPGMFVTPDEVPDMTISDAELGRRIATKTGCETFTAFFGMGLREYAWSDLPSLCDDAATNGNLIYVDNAFDAIADLLGVEVVFDAS
jgi:hypothetical protein